jgi:hypothetical protein
MSRALALLLVGGNEGAMFQHCDNRNCPITLRLSAPLPKCHVRPHEGNMDHRTPLIPLLAGTVLLLGLSGCGVEQARPAPVADAERWGHLPPDPERPQQAGRTDPGAAVSRS